MDRLAVSMVPVVTVVHPQCVAESLGSAMDRLAGSAMDRLDGSAMELIASGETQKRAAAVLVVVVLLVLHAVVLLVLPARCVADSPLLGSLFDGHFLPDRLSLLRRLVRRLVRVPDNLFRGLFVLAPRLFRVEGRPVGRPWDARLFRLSTLSLQIYIPAYNLPTNSILGRRF